MFSRPTIILVQFRSTPGAGRLELQSISREVSSYINVIPVCGLSENILEMAKKAQGVILGGSGDLDFDGARASDDPVRKQTRLLVESLSHTLDYLFIKNKPLFGICFGHQLMGAFNGVDVCHDKEQSKMKTHTVSLSDNAKEHTLCTDLPSTFSAQYGHKDVLTHVPTGATLLAHGGDACRVSALAYSDVIISTQFHPELTVEDMHDRVAHIPNYLPEGVRVDDVFTDTPHARILLHNFAQKCVI